MIFWIEEDTEVSYDQFFEDIKKKEASFSLPGYDYFLSLLIQLLGEYKPNSIEHIINYLIKSKSDLNFLIYTLICQTVLDM